MEAVPSARSHPLRIRLPEQLYRQLQARAQVSQRTVEEELISLAASVTAEPDTLPADVEERLESMSVLSDSELLSILRQLLPVAKAQSLERLNAKQSSAGLTRAEARKHRSLVSDCEWHLLRRSRALSLLVERGHDVSAWSTP